MIYFDLNGNGIIMSISHANLRITNYRGKYRGNFTEKSPGFSKMSSNRIICAAAADQSLITSKSLFQNPSYKQYTPFSEAGWGLDV